MIKLLPHQDASDEELLYARLDGRHTAMESKRKAEEFLYLYTTKLAPNKIIAREFMDAYKDYICVGNSKIEKVFDETVKGV
jgi:hypothetical protein